MKNQNFQMVFKTVEMKAGKIKITGFASTPEIDRYDDIVKPSAFQGAMVGYMKNPVVLLQHNAEKPIGQVISYQILSTGLEVTAEISNDIENTFQLIQDKILRGFSIGFIAKSWNMTETNGREIREITDVDLIEISVVSTPANPGSLFTLAKSVREFFLTKDKESKDVEIIAETPEEVIEEIIESVEPETEVVEEVAEELKTAEVEPEAVAEEVAEVVETPEVVEESKSFYILEKKELIMMPGDVKVGDMITFKEKPSMEYNPWVECETMSEPEIMMGEIIKIQTDGFLTDDGELEAISALDPVLYISCYCQTLENGMVPSEDVEVEKFSELMINKSASQKSIEIKTDNLEISVETTDTPEKVEEEAEVIEAIEPEAVLPEVNAEVEALKTEVAELKEDIADKAEKMASMEYVIANLTEKSVSLEEKMQKV